MWYTSALQQRLYRAEFLPKTKVESFLLGMQVSNARPAWTSCCNICGCLVYYLWKQSTINFPPASGFDITHMAPEILFSLTVFPPGKSLNPIVWSCDHLADAIRINSNTILGFQNICCTIIDFFSYSYSANIRSNRHDSNECNTIGFG